MDTQTQIERLIELAIVQRTELKELVAQLPQLREHLSTEIEKAFDEAEPQLRAELEEWTTKEAADKTAALGVALEAKIAELAKNLEVTTQARYNAIIGERDQNARISAEAEAKIAEHAASLPGAVKEIVTAELARFPRAGEIDQLRKEFAEPRGLNPRGKWQAGESYSKLDFVTINGDSYASNIDNNRTRPSRSSADWTLVAARGTGGGGGPTSLSELTTVPSDGDILIGSGTSWVTSNLTAGAGISITVGPGAITISATDGDITLDDGTAASPSLHFTNDPDTGIYRPAANTLGISTSGVQRMYVDENGITTVGAGATFDGSVHAANGNANNPSYSFSGDQDTGFFRHQPNEIGIALGGTQYATLTSTTFSITPVVTMASSLRVNGTTDSSSKDTGAIVTEGGLGVEKSASIGGNLTVSGTGTIGSGGTGATTGTLLLSGSSANDTGPYITFSRNSVAKGYIGTASGVTGGSSDNLVVYTSALAATFSGANTTLAGNLTVSGGSIVLGSSSSVLYLGTPSSNYLYYDGSSLFVRLGGADRLTIPAASGNLLIGTTTDGGQKLQVSGTAAISGALSIGNTVQTAVSVASTHKVTISIGGSTYYLLATNV